MDDMIEWKETKIGEIAEVQTGPFGSQLHAKDYVQQGIPSIMPVNIGNRLEIIRSGLVFISENDAKRLEKYLVLENDIVLSRRGDVEKSAFITSKESGWLCGTGCLRIRFKSNKIIPKFCAYYISTEESKAWLTNHAVGTTMPNLNSDILSRLPILLPPLPEQTAIAEILSSLDDKIDLLQRQNATLESMAETLFRQWFVEEAKEDWEEVKLVDYVQTNSRSIDRNYRHEVIAYLDTSSVTSGNFNIPICLHLIDAPSRARRLVQHNDIIISTVRPDQKHYGLIKNPQSNLVVSTGFCVITCTGIDPHFVYMLLTSGEMTELLHSIAEGSTSTYPSLKPSDIEQITFQKPPAELLNSFSQLAEAYWAKIHFNQTQIRTLTSMRDTLLPKLMSGEINLETN